MSYLVQVALVCKPSTNYSVVKNKEMRVMGKAGVIGHYRNDCCEKNTSRYGTADSLCERCIM